MRSRSRHARRRANRRRPRPRPAASATAPAVTRRPLPEVRRRQPQPARDVSRTGGIGADAPDRRSGRRALRVRRRNGSPLQQTAIEYAEKVEAMCRKHPEMGPCQYERNACRRKGGRVFAADGTEITLATEAEYDKKVRRVQFKAN